MKKITVMLVLFCAVLISSCGLKSTEISGYIPEDQKPFYVWTETRPGSENWECHPTIMVIVAGDTIRATFSQGSFAGSYAVRYRDSYPPVIGKKIYVRMNFSDGGYYIFDASPTDLTTKRIPIGTPAWH